MRRQETLIAADQFDVSQPFTGSAAHVVGRELVRGGVTVRRVAAIDVRNQSTEIPVDAWAIADAQIDVAIDRLALDLLAAPRVIDGCGLDVRNRMGAIAQLVLADEVVFQIDSPAGLAE